MLNTRGSGSVITEYDRDLTFATSEASIMASPSMRASESASYASCLFAKVSIVIFLMCGLPSANFLNALSVKWVGSPDFDRVIEVIL